MDITIALALIVSVTLLLVLIIAMNGDFRELTIRFTKWIQFKLKK